MTIDDQPWFVAADVCRVLGLKGDVSLVCKRVASDERSVFVTPTSDRGQGKPPKLTIISESGLYKLIMRSDKPWFVAGDVCRVLGVSNTSQALRKLDDNEQTLIRNETQAQRTAPYWKAISESGHRDQHGGRTRRPSEVAARPERRQPGITTVLWGSRGRRITPELWCNQNRSSLRSPPRRLGRMD